MKLKFILASASPRRKELVSHLKIPFEIIPADIDEEISAPHPRDLVKTLAVDKGKATFDKYKASAGAGNDCFVLSADTLVALEDKVYSKPKDVKDAGRMLMELSGKSHQVFTGVAFILNYKGQKFTHSFVVESKVTFDQISEEILQIYLDTKESLDKAGSYGIQGPSLTFISKLEGSYSNVVGLPLSDVVSEMKNFLGRHIPGKMWRELFV